MLRLKENFSPMIFQGGRKAEYADFIAFQEDVLDNPLDLYALLGPAHPSFFVVKYTGCGQEAEEIIFNAANSEIPTVGGEYIEYAYPKLFDSPYLESEYESGVISGRKGDLSIKLDFNE